MRLVSIANGNCQISPGKQTLPTSTSLRVHVSQKFIRATMPASRHAWQRLELIMASTEESMTDRAVACVSHNNQFLPEHVSQTCIVCRRLTRDRHLTFTVTSPSGHTLSSPGCLAQQPTIPKSILLRMGPYHCRLHNCAS
jgi:hypothetical protein